MNIKNKIIYEVYIKSFNDSTGNGAGDIKGIIQKIPYLKSLGITTLWITPFYDSPMKDEGYDISDYTNVNPLFGVESDIDDLIKICKQENLEIMLDFVLNHTSSNHKWFKRAINGEKEFQDYYFFFDSPKTQWIGRFGGGVWEYVPEIKKYYLHLYDKNQPDLNWDNPIVRANIFKIVDFWLSKGITAYKFDVLYLISKPTKNWEPRGVVPSAVAVSDGQHVHAYIKELMKKIKAKYPDTYAVGEMSFSSLDQCIKYSCPDSKEVDIIMTGRIAHGMKPKASDSIMREDKPDMVTYISILKYWINGLQNGNGQITNFTENHDSVRTANRFGDLKYWEKSSKAHIMNIAFLWGIPLFLQGQEIGMLNPEYKDVSDYVDIKSVNALKEYSNRGFDEDVIRQRISENGRDAGRNPMIWNKEYNGGWTTSKKPWRKTTNEAKLKTNVLSQEHDPNSILNFFREVMKLRSSTNVLKYGDIEFVDDIECILKYKRSYEGKTFLFIFNFSSKIQKSQFKYKINALFLANYDEQQINDQMITLKPWESVVYILK